MWNICYCIWLTFKRLYGFLYFKLNSKRFSANFDDSEKGLLDKMPIALFTTFCLKEFLQHFAIYSKRLLPAKDVSFILYVGPNLKEKLVFVPSTLYNIEPHLVKWYYHIIFVILIKINRFLSLWIEKYFINWMLWDFYFLL